MKVSVIVPVYNVGKYLRQCLDSLVGQTLRDIEIICVNDGSTDGSGAILDEYAARDPRVKVIHQANAGAGPARNAGLDVAQGEYLFFCDPDDSADAVMLERLWERALADSAEIVLTGRKLVGRPFRRTEVMRVARVLSERGRPFAGSEFPDNLFTLARAALWDKLFSRVFIESRGIRFQSVPHTNDLYFTVVALASANRIAVDDGAYYRHVLRRMDSLQNTKDRDALVFLSVHAAIVERLRELCLESTFRNALAVLLLHGGIREINTLRQRENRERFYSRLRDSFLKCGWDEQFFVSVPLTSRERAWQRLLFANARPDAILDECARHTRCRRISNIVRVVTFGIVRIK